MSYSFFWVRKKERIGLALLSFLFFFAPIDAKVPFNQCKRCTLRGTQLSHFNKAYETYHYEKTLNDVVRIPKKIHQIWLGKPLPKVFKPLTETWKTFHPDWEYHLWTDADIGSFPLLTGDLIHKATNLGQRSDIFRLEILNRFGGLYVDTDFICLQAHDCFHHTADFYAGMENRVIGNALIGAAPGHPILRACLKKLKKLKKFSRQSVQATTGPFFLTEMIKHHMLNTKDRTIIYPCAYFYPLHCNLRDQVWDQNRNYDAIKPFIKPETHSAHLWAGSWNPLRKEKFADSN